MHPDAYEHFIIKFKKRMVEKVLKKREGLIFGTGVFLAKDETVGLSKKNLHLSRM